MRYVLLTIILCLQSCAWGSVVVSIKPFYGLVAKLTQNTPITLTLLYDGAQSPHTHDITPTQALALKQADLLIWGGAIYETHLARMTGLPKHALDVSKTPGLMWLSLRSLHTCGHHQDHCEKAKRDGHYFLHPGNAVIILTHMANILSQHFPKHATIFQKNAKIGARNITTFYHTQQQRLHHAGGHTLRYRIFHDCMVYFDAAFGTQSQGTLGGDSHHGPSVKDTLAILKSLDATDLILFEDRFPSALIQKLADHGIPARRIDYLGTNLPLSPHVYEDIITSMVDVFMSHHPSVLSKSTYI